jgi:pimeloyl-ACP methyl ester carboxylesterase
MASRADTTVRLPDGRTLGYIDWADTGGMPVLHFHGVPSSCLEGQHLASQIEENGLGVRLISIDRPGHGLSDFQRRRKLLDWPNDVVAVANALELEKFAVLGYSGGGPYALACAFKIPKRLTSVAVVAGMPPPSAPKFLDGLGATDRRLIRLARRAPWVARAALRVAGSLAARDPERSATEFEKELSEADRAVFADPRLRLIVNEMFLESIRNGTRGVVHEYKLLGRSWGFALDAIEVPVQFWQGEEDEVVSPAHAEYQAGEVRDSKLGLCKGVGHLLNNYRWREIARSLTA